MTRISTSVFVSLLLASLCGCASSVSATDPHAMGASQHEAAGAEEDAISAKHAAKYDPNAKASTENCSGGSAARLEGSPCWSEVVNPTEAHLADAKLHAKFAADHRAASKALQDAEAKSCVGIDPSDRDVSPFHHPTDIAEVKVLGPPGAETGVEVVFKPVLNLTVDKLQHIVECHLARNAALGHKVPEMPYCPLVPIGAVAKVAKVGESLSVTISDTDPAAMKEIVLRSKQLGI